MNIDELTQFNLSFPGQWIEGDVRDWASENHLTLCHITGLYEEAVAAYTQFDPITARNYKDVSRLLVKTAESTRLNFLILPYYQQKR